MKTIILFSLFAFYSTSNATVFRVNGFAPILEKEIEIQAGQTVSEVTLRELKIAKDQKAIVDFKADSLFLRVIETSTDGKLDQKWTTQSESEVRAFGWCFAINDQVPDTLPDEYALTGTEKSITWFYSYASRIYGRWTTQCVPVYAP